MKPQNRLILKLTHALPLVRMTGSLLAAPVSSAWWNLILDVRRCYECLVEERVRGEFFSIHVIRYF